MRAIERNNFRFIVPEVFRKLKESHKRYYRGVYGDKKYMFLDDIFRERYALLAQRKNWPEAEQIYSPAGINNFLSTSL